MSSDIGITIGMVIIAFMLFYLSVETEIKPLKFLSFIFALLFIVASIAIMAVGATTVATVSMVYSTMSLTVALLIFTLLYYTLSIVKDILESIQK